jgi:hypothetical protein
LSAEGLDYSADFLFSLFDRNAFNIASEEDIPGLDLGSSVASSVANLSVGGYLANKSGIDRRYYNGEITADSRDALLETVPRWKISSTIDLSKAYTAETSKATTTSSQRNYYEYVQKIIDWYEDNRYEYGLPSIAWPTTTYGGEMNQTKFITGSTCLEPEDVVWTEATWSDARLLFTNVKAMVEARINAISPDIDIETNESLPDQFHLSGSALIAAQKEKKAWDEYSTCVYGTNSSASWSLPFTNTRLDLIRLFDCVDAGFFLDRAELAVGDRLSSSRLRQAENGSGVELSLTDNLISGFDAGARFQMSGGEESAAEDWLTLASELYSGESAVAGVLAWAKGSFRTRADFFDVYYVLGLQGGVLDFAHPINSAGSATVRVDFEMPTNVSFLPGDQGISAIVDSEVDCLGYDDKYRTGEETLGCGVDTSIDIRYAGFGPVATFRYKSAGFGGESYGNLTEDRYSGASLGDDFEQTTLSSAMALEAGLSFSALKLFRRDVELYGSWQKMLTGSVRSGWKAGLRFAFSDSPAENAPARDFLAIPLGGEFEVSQYGIMPLVGHVRLNYYPSGCVTFFARADLTYNCYRERVMGYSAGVLVSCK